MSSISCIEDSQPCQYTDSTRYCCSGICDQNAGDEFGNCAVTVTSTTLVPSTTNDSATCLKAGMQCSPNGELGTCCSFNCFKLKGQLFGTCVGSEPPTGIPPKCLGGGADCTVSGSMGFCCSGHCNVIAPHTIGTCDHPAVKTTELPRHVEISNSPSWIIYTSITLSIMIMVMLAFLWLYRRQRKLEKVISQKELDQFFYGDAESAHFNGYAHENADLLPYKKELEISEGDYSIDTGSQLGSGCFGLVLKGKVRGEEVAAKTIRSNLDNNGTMLRSLLSEIKILQYIGSFENIVSMVGCNTANLKNGKVFLFLEYCPLGSLEKYLRTNKFNYVDNYTADGQSNYVNMLESDIENALDANKLIQWCLQITNAMKFLATKKVIHADLATRNVLLLQKDCVKLTDFGLSRRLYEYGNYVKKHQEPLPWRYMSPESLSELTFSHQSDVWSLGITYWEIYTLGEVPYPGLSWTNEFISCLKNGLRPAKPINASDKLYDIMLDCWERIPDTRPTFEELHKRLYEYQKTIE